MRAALGLLGILLTGGIFGYLYRVQLRAGGEAPTLAGQVDMIGLRSDLLSLAQAERRYRAANGRYATLDELRQTAELSATGTVRRGYRYDIEITESVFRITARPDGVRNGAGPVLSIDETMRIAVEESER